MWSRPIIGASFSYKDLATFEKQSHRKFKPLEHTTGDGKRASIPRQMGFDFTKRPESTYLKTRVNTADKIKQLEAKMKQLKKK